MAQIIKIIKILGNSSLGIDLAEATKVPRLAPVFPEACPGFPFSRQVHGENAFKKSDFYFHNYF